MGLMIRGRAMRRLNNARHKRRSRHGVAHASGSMVMHTTHRWHAMKSCAVSGGWDVPLGNARAAIIIVAWLKTAMFRIKTIFGDRVRARTFAGQAAAMLIRCRALNRLTHLR